MEISEKLKILREEKNLTQKDVATYLDLSRKTISGWENHRSFPDISSLVKLSKLYGISLDDLLNDENMLDHYKEQNSRNNRLNKVFFIVYEVNCLFTFLSYLRYFGLFNNIKFIFPIVMLICSVVVVITYPDWGIISFKKMILKILLVTGVTLIVCISELVFFEKSINISSQNLVFITGEIIGKIVFMIFLMFGTICAFILKPSFRKRTN
ncbi:helix-turn-helix transcriptional regulator [Lentilactobacillus sp. Marseille-Q4993]|uniref:helix-turn-helix domain-containing protein n=1 Tax=Lentilactobacillus sp. Marseille-Q4993 TaxID=3039492 RepID=UPI0024BC15FA|nr:helix-turn-helix transcriptional regulator [Lentilactobacillus sp. Marseille-Q4993]